MPTFTIPTGKQREHQLARVLAKHGKLTADGVLEQWETEARLACPMCGESIGSRPYVLVVPATLRELAASTGRSSSIKALRTEQGELGLGPTWQDGNATDLLVHALCFYDLCDAPAERPQL
jgi:hypothetical protein